MTEEGWPRKVIAGTGVLNVHPMHSTDIPAGGPRHMSVSALCQMQQDLQANGYLLLRHALPASMVMTARQVIVKDLASNGFLDTSAVADRDTPIQQDLLLDISKTLHQNCVQCPFTTVTSPQLLSRQNWIKAQPELMNVLEHQHLQDLADLFLATDSSILVDKTTLVDDMDDCARSDTSCDMQTEKDTPSAMTLPFKWLRAVGTGLYTGLHCDRVYVGHISQRQLTLWIPIGHVTSSMGSIVVSSGSHRNQVWKDIRDSYSQGRAGVDGTQSGWLCLDPREIESRLLASAPTGIHSLDWVTTDFCPGDVCVLDLNVMHMSTTNITHDWRLSCDTRWLSI
ncbi:hypothetical protein RTP6_003164 [Batrachochytrium dendrobatidis]